MPQHYHISQHLLIFGKSGILLTRIMMYQSIFILGRLPGIGCAELESLYGGEHIERIAPDVAASDLPYSQITFARLGGSIKLGQVAEIVPATDWRSVQAALINAARQLAQTVDEGKIQLGISAHGISANPRQLMAAGLEAKKALRKDGYSVRLIPNQDVALSSAQTLHNHLTGSRGIELLAVRHGQHTIIARCVAVQDINAYAARDQGRPKRDAFVGMLPPKLAQSIVNLATGPLPPSPQTVVLDPFCGTGVVLQESLLMGYGVFGSDINQKMVDFSVKNVSEWFLTNHPEIHAKMTIALGDATDYRWGDTTYSANDEPIFEPETIAAVACESYLGRPLSSWPKPETLQEIMAACNTIIDKFMRNLATQIKPGTRCCIAVPAWLGPNGVIHRLPLLDRLNDLGYNRVSFEHVRDTELLYSRPDQIVGRELLVITRK